MNNKKELIVKQTYTLPSIIFILINLIFVIFSAIFIFDLLINTININTIEYILAFVFLISFLRALMFLIKFILFDEIIFKNETITINEKKYNFSDIELQYVNGGGFSTVLEVILYSKHNNKTISRIVLSFWGGNLMNITEYNFSSLFDKNQTSDEFNKKIQSIDIEKEKEDIKQFNFGGYFFILVVSLPILLYIVFT